MKLRHLEEKFIKAVILISFFIVMASFILILTTILIKGAPSLNIKMITQTPKGGYYLGREGGILNAIIGSLLIAGGASVISIILSIPITLYMNVYCKRKSKFVNSLRFFFDVLCGIPSIVYGALGLVIMYFFGLRASLLGGIIAITLLIMPIMCRSIDEVMKMIPEQLLETSYALGSSRYQTAFIVVIKQCIPGIITALLIAFGRGIGDAAAVLFTAGFSDHIPYSLTRPAASLPLAIFFQLTSPIKEVQNRAYAAGLILTILILVLSITARLIAKKYEKFRVK